MLTVVWIDSLPFAAVFHFVAWFSIYISRDIKYLEFLALGSMSGKFSLVFVFLECFLWLNNISLNEIGFGFKGRHFILVTLHVIFFDMEPENKIVHLHLSVLMFEVYIYIYSLKSLQDDGSFFIIASTWKCSLILQPSTSSSQINYYSSSTWVMIGLESAMENFKNLLIINFFELASSIL